MSILHLGHSKCAAANGRDLAEAVTGIHGVGGMKT
jgi:hypothetical protein